MWTTLFTIAVSLGAQYLIDKYQNDKAKQNSASTNDVLKIINGLVNKAADFGSDKLAEVSNKLNALSIPFISSDKVKGIINKARIKLEKTQKDLTKAIQDKDTAMNDIKERASSLAYQPASYRNSSTGKQEIEDLKNEAINASNLHDAIIKGVEQNV